MNLDLVHGSKPFGYRAVGMGVAPSEMGCKFVPIASFCTVGAQLGDTAAAPLNMPPYPPAMADRLPLNDDHITGLLAAVRRRG